MNKLHVDVIRLPCRLRTGLHMYLHITTLSVAACDSAFSAAYILHLTASCTIDSAQLHVAILQSILIEILGIAYHLIVDRNLFIDTTALELDNWLVTEINYTMIVQDVILGLLGK